MASSGVAKSRKRKWYNYDISILKSKGIEEARAISAAREIVLEGSKNTARAARPLKIIGWIFIAIGIFTPVATLVMNRGFYVVTLGPIALGAAMVWGGYRGDE